MTLAAKAEAEQLESRHRISVLTRWFALRKLGRLDGLRLNFTDNGALRKLLIVGGNLEAALVSPEWEPTTFDFVEKHVADEEAKLEVENTVAKILRREVGRCELGSAEKSKVG